MFKHFSETIVNSAIERDIIKNEDKEESIYGLNTFLTLAVNVLSALLIGFLFHMLAEIALFIFVYRSLRKYIGGSHADTALCCYISSCMTYVVVLVFIKYYPISSMATTALMACSMLVLWILAPIEAPKKPLDEIEYKVFRRRSHITIIICLCVFLILHYIPNQYTYYCSNIIAVSVYAVTLFAVIGKVQLKHLKTSPAHH